MKVSEIKAAATKVVAKSVEKPKEEVTVYRSPKGTVTITRNAGTEKTAKEVPVETKKKGKRCHCGRFLSRDGYCHVHGKVGGSVIARTVEEAKERRAKEAYFAKRNKFYADLRATIKEYEDFQKELKSKIRNYHSDGTVKGKEYHKGDYILLLNNTEIVTLLYFTMSYVRRGEAIAEELEKRGYTFEELETFINGFFRKKPAFREMYWTIWKKKFA